MNEISLSSPDATASPTGIVLSAIGSFFLAIGLIFGIRDAWVEIWGVNGSIAGGLGIGVFMLIPVASVILSVSIARRQAQSQATTLMRAGMVAIGVSLPVALILAIAAAY